MARLPIVNGDDNIWGLVLNDFLSVSLDADGSIKASALSNKADVTAVMSLSDSQTVAGIKTFSSSPIVPTPTAGGQLASKSYIDGVMPAVVVDATALVKGKIQLAGDLGGTAAAPTAPTVLRKSTLLFNVKDYGATGDGTTDDTAAIVTAEAARAAQSGGGILYFPAGTYIVSPTGDATNKICIPVSGQNLDVRGAGAGRSIIKIKDNVGDYSAMFAASSGATDTSGLTFRNITLDGNSAGNVITNTAPLGGSFPRHAVRHVSGQRVLIEGCRFVNWDCVGVLVLNSSGLTDVIVRNCLFDDTGANSPAHAHSSIYVAAQRMEINGCTFIGGGISATTAIETHGGFQNVHHNRIFSYKTGMQVSGIAASTIGVIVDSNILQSCGSGIGLVSQTVSGNATVWGMERAKVSNNIISLDFDTWGSGTGIGTGTSDTLGYKDLHIIDNSITFKSFSGTPTSGDNLDVGIRLYRSASYAGVDQDILIERNTIDQPIAGGIYFNLANTSTNRLTIRDNRVVNVGQNNAGAFADSYKVAIIMAGVLKDVRVNRNSLIDDRGIAVMTAGIDTQGVTSTTNCEAVDNDMHIADSTASVPDFLASATPAPFYVRFRSNKYVQPTQAVMAGSTILEAATGLVYTQTATSSGTNWAVKSSLPIADTILVSSGYYYTPSGAHLTLLGVLNTEYASPIWIGSNASIARIACEVVTPQTNAVVRLGVRSDSGGGVPGNVLIDAGTINASVGGAAEITLGSPVAITAGLYWLTATVQGTAVTQPTLRALTGTLMPVGPGSLAGALGTTTANGYTRTGVSGALTNPYTITSQTGAAPLVALRFS